MDSKLVGVGGGAGGDAVLFEWPCYHLAEIFAANHTDRNTDTYPCMLPFSFTNDLCGDIEEKPEAQLNLRLRANSETSQKQADCISIATEEHPAESILTLLMKEFWGGGGDSIS
ncbi:hypothetical protein Q8A73_021623 [Channa argus]|nr:hypothetical protein Q8A73_021623 [Channa argus]